MVRWTKDKSPWNLHRMFREGVDMIRTSQTTPSMVCLAASPLSNKATLTRSSTSRAFVMAYLSSIESQPNRQRQSKMMKGLTSLRKKQKAQLTNERSKSWWKRNPWSSCSTRPSFSVWCYATFFKASSSCLIWRCLTYSKRSWTWSRPSCRSTWASFRYHGASSTYTNCWARFSTRTSKSRKATW